MNGGRSCNQASTSFTFVLQSAYSCIMHAETDRNFLHGIIAGGIRSDHGRFFICYGILVTG